MNHHNYLHQRRPLHTQAEHDRAFLRTLIALIIICVIAVLADKAFSQDEPITSHEPKKAEPEVGAKAKAESPESPAVAKPVYSPTEAQADKLRIVQLEAINARQAWDTAAQRIPEYQTLQQAVNNIYAVCARIKSEDKWPADIGCDINKNPITFEKIPAVQSMTPAAPAATTTPTPKPSPFPATAPSPSTKKPKGESK